ncbi:MAG: transcriptional regulator, IclR family [Conexibacter sp.]|nr:transcriptional regulator, IclR family [Conexibacter sp.]
MEAWHVARTMRVLELLAYAPLSVPQLAEALGANPRTVRRVVGQLVEEEYLVRGAGPRWRYRPTMRLVALAGQTLNNSTLIRHARPYVALAHERTDAIAELLMPSYQSVLCVLRCGTDGEVIGPAVQQVVPAHCCAGGKVLLARRDRWRDSVLATTLERRADQTITDPLSLRRELEAVRADGYAIQTGEAAGMSAAAAPIVDAGETVAALQVHGIGLDHYAARLVVRSARELSETLAVERDA